MPTRPSKRSRSALARRYGASVNNLSHVPTSRGIYVLYGAGGAVAYVGTARSLRQAINRHIESGDVPVTRFAFVEADSMEAAQKKQRELIALYNPPYNMTSMS